MAGFIQETERLSAAYIVFSRENFIRLNMFSNGKLRHCFMELYCMFTCILTTTTPMNMFIYRATWTFAHNKLQYNTSENKINMAQWFLTNSVGN